MISESAIDLLTHVTCLAQQYGFVIREDLRRAEVELNFWPVNPETLVTSWLDGYEYTVVEYPCFFEMGSYQYDSVMYQETRSLVSEFLMDLDYEFSKKSGQTILMRSWAGERANNILFRRLELNIALHLMVMLRYKTIRDEVRRILVDHHDKAFQRYFVRSVRDTALLGGEIDKVKRSNLLKIRFVILSLDKLYSRRSSPLVLIREILKLKLSKEGVEAISQAYKKLIAGECSREVKLLDKIDKKYYSIRNELICNNMRLMRFFKSPKSLASATFGMIRAIEMFDFRSGFKFSTYAMGWMKSKVVRDMESLPIVRYPTHKIEAAGGVIALMSLFVDLSELEGRKVDTTEEIEFTESCITGYVNNLRVLTSRERFVIEKRFGLCGNDELTLEQIGQLLGVSRERVRQLERSAIEKIRSKMEFQKKRWV